ncbi:MAG: B12-binding domain-containing radical SAM protein [Fidelibacterota bacterium]
MFNICLIQPPIEDFYATPIRNIPLGLLSIGATLSARHRVRLLDLRQSKRRTVPVPADLSAVAPYYRAADASPFGLYKRYARYGLTAAEIAAYISRDDDVFLISALFTTYIHEILEMLPLIREKCPQSWIVIGGGGACSRIGEFFRAGADFVIAGEGEIAVLRLLAELQKTRPDFAAVPNLIWRKQDRTVHNPMEFIQPLDELPFPDYTLSGVPEYNLAGKKHAMLMTSRGCPHRCEFCAVPSLFGERYRLRSVPNVLTELSEKIQQGFRSFDFEDDHFGGKRRWLADLLDGIAVNFGAYELSFQAMNGITATNLDRSILTKMKQVGFTEINLSLVTPRRDRQDALRRPFHTRQFIDVVAAAYGIGLTITAYLIIGLPGDTVEDNLEAILFLSELPVRIGPSLFYLVPGAPLFDTLRRQNAVPTAVRCYRSSYFPCEQPGFSRTSAMTLFRICRIINFLKAVRETGDQPTAYQIRDEAVVLPDQLSGRQSRITLGFALLELLRERGILYGTDKKRNGHYPLYPERVDNRLIDRFRRRWLR